MDFCQIYEILTKSSDYQPYLTEISKNLNIKYSVLYSAVTKVLKMKFKKCSRINKKQNSSENILQFLNFGNQLIKYLHSNYLIIFIDECKFNLYKKNPMKWVVKNGNNVFKDCGKIKGLNLTLVCSNFGIIHHEVTEDNLNSNTFIDFIDKLLGCITFDKKLNDL